MKIQITGGTKRIAVRYVDGKPLDRPIEVEFTDGVAEVDNEVGRTLAKMFNSITVVRSTPDPEEDKE